MEHAPDPVAKIRRRAMCAPLCWIGVALLTALLTACAGIKLVADYDAEAAKAIADTSASVFAFYDRMISARAAPPRPATLAYREFADDWGRIETQIRVMLVREESRPLNADSEAITKRILEFWAKYRHQHLTSDDYNARLLTIHRDRFQRLFAAALRAEKAKQLNAADSNPAAAETEP
jgi:hypothetical protein